MHNVKSIVREFGKYFWNQKSIIILVVIISFAYIIKAFYKRISNLQWDNSINENNRHKI